MSDKGGEKEEVGRPITWAEATEAMQKMLEEAERRRPDPVTNTFVMGGTGGMKVGEVVEWTDGGVAVAATQLAESCIERDEASEHGVPGIRDGAKLMGYFREAMAVIRGEKGEQVHVELPKT